MTTILKRRSQTETARAAIMPGEVRYRELATEEVAHAIPLPRKPGEPTIKEAIASIEKKKQGEQ